MKAGRPSLQAVSEGNHARLLSYIASLRSKALPLPGHLGKVNKTAVANECGFSRETFQQNQRFAATLAAAVQELGVGLPEADDPRERNAAEKARISKLEQQLTALRSENYELRKRLRRYEAIADHMVATGRRVLP